MEKILNSIPKKGNVVIIGYPATGKTFLLDTIITACRVRASTYHTDDYIKHGFVEALYVLMEEIAKDKTPLKIIEGVLGYRLIRKGIELHTFHADLVIVCEASVPTRTARIVLRGKLVQATLSMDKGLEKVWEDCKAMGSVGKVVRWGN